MRKFCILMLALFVCACGSKAPSESRGMVNGKPYWYWTPSEGDMLGGVGEAGFHVSGPSAQRELAVQRAIDSIARQKGVTVRNIQSVEQTSASSGSSNVLISGYSVHTVEGVVLSTQIREVWQDPATSKLVVWVTETK